MFDLKKLFWRSSAVAQAASEQPVVSPAVKHSAGLKKDTMTGPLTPPTQLDAVQQALFNGVENTNAKVDTAGAKPVYITLVMGKDAYASVSVRGKNGTEMIFKPLTDGGVANALNQVGSVGWKMYCGAKILNELFIVRIESVATLDVGNLIRYADNTATVSDATTIE